VTTKAVSKLTSAVITASLNGTSETATLNITPPALQGVSLKPASVAPGASSVGTVQLSSIAPAGGSKVTLSSGSGVVVPASVTVAAGKSTATFTVKTSKSAPAGAITVTASFSGLSYSATLTIQ
jgi:hypothetical protein